MSEEPVEDLGPALPEKPEREIVHWMDRKPLSVGPLGLSATAVGAFSLGMVAGMAVFALAGWLPEREVLVRRRRRDL
jgi:hypothetical protein